MQGRKGLGGPLTSSYFSPEGSFNSSEAGRDGGGEGRREGAGVWWVACV